MRKLYQFLKVMCYGSTTRGLSFVFIKYYNLQQCDNTIQISTHIQLVNDDLANYKIYILFITEIITLLCLYK